MKKFKIGIMLFVALFSVGTIMAQSIDDAKRFIYYERYKSAKDVLQKMIAANPANEEAVYLLGQAEIGLENVPGARTIYLNALNANPNSPLILAGMGHIELIEGKNQDARSRFETAISLSKAKSIPVLNAVGYANANPDLKNGDAAYAIDQLKKATLIKGFKDAEVWANLGDAYRKSGDGGGAVQSYEQALRLDPNYARASYRLGKLYQTQGRQQETLYLRYFNEAMAKDPKYAPIYSNLFDYYYETDVPKAAQYMERFLTNSDDDPKACYYRASIKYAQGLFQDAITKANECISKEGATPYPNLYGIKAYAYNKLKDSANAKAMFEEFFKKQTPEKIGGGDYSTYAALLLKFPGNETLAGTYVQKAIAMDSIEVNKVNYLKSMAVAYESQKNYKEAANWYSKVIATKKNYSNVDLFNAGYNHYLATQLDSSNKYFKLYVDKYPDDVLAYYMLGNANALIDSTGNLGLAVPYYQKVVDISEADTTKSSNKPRLLTAYKFFVGYYYNNKKDRATALTYVEKALKLDPTDANMLANKEFITKNDPNAPPRRAPAPKPGSKKKK